MAIAGIFLFSAKAVLVKIAYQYQIDSVSLLLLRMVFALPVYLIILMNEWKKPKPGVVTRKDYISVVALGLMGYYLASFFDFHGLKYITASLERLILFIYPTLVVVISALVFRKNITVNQTVAILLTYLGILVTFIPDLGSQGKGDVWTGSVLIFLSAFTYAMYIVGSGNLIPRMGPRFFTALVMTVSCCCVFVHYAIVNESDITSFPWEIYVIGFVMAIFSTVIPSFLVSMAIKKIGSSNFAIIGSVGPISTIVLAALFLQEVITTYQMIGTVIVIGGIAVLRKKKTLHLSFGKVRKK